MSWYIAALKKYATFSGRARRKEYWMFMLLNFIFLLLTINLDFIILDSTFILEDGSTMGIVSLIYSFAIILPSLAVTVRRLHDIGKSGWWMFITLVPLIGGLWLLIYELTNSQPGENIYGPNPKGIEHIST